MQERIARAIYCRMGGVANHYDGLSKQSKAEFLGDALAVMKAMREPVVGMLIPGGEYVLNEVSINHVYLMKGGSGFDIKGRETIAYELWRAMLDAEIAAAEEPGHE